jgi:hypothetical protein
MRDLDVNSDCATRVLVQRLCNGLLLGLMLFELLHGHLEPPPVVDVRLVCPRSLLT